ncbi:hypothetical protein [Curtobacterium herbarum]|nr:hypothetical protein [Curtobacterium herbarum]MBM7474411.1 hypothetical protein [Curtobacterium herbarum]MCS6545796.1 hypothetical protein [Curtobacterium herbarum]
MNALEQETVRMTADATGLSADHRVVWARLGRLEALCAEALCAGALSAGRASLRTTTTTI